MTLVCTSPYLAALRSRSGIGCLEHGKHSTGPVKTETQGLGKTRQLTDEK